VATRRILVGLIGRNIQGSPSPALFADAFAAVGIDGFYHLMDVDRLPGRQLPQLLEAIKVAGFAGANITYPFKQDIIPLLDAIDPEAAQVGAINTVAIAVDGRTTGYNFDRRGWRNSFAERVGQDSAQGKTVVLIGAGGAGRAVAFALMDLSVAAVVLHDLDRSRASALQVDVSGGQEEASDGAAAVAIPPRADANTKRLRHATANATARQRILRVPPSLMAVRLARSPGRKHSAVAAAVSR